MEWLKWIGILMIGGGLACVGFRMAYCQECRLEEYRLLQKLLTILMSRMRIGESMETALECCAMAGAGPWEEWLMQMSQRLARRELLSEVWKEELKKAKQGLHLEKEDYQMLEALGKTLQGARLENCLGAISQLQDYFYGQQKMLEQVIVEQGRLYRSIGVLVGILVMVVLA